MALFKKTNSYLNSDDSTIRGDIQKRPVDDLIRIIHAGGAITVDATRPVEELLKLAGAAAAAKVKIVMAESEYKNTDDLVRIAQAGAGNVIFQ